MVVHIGFGNFVNKDKILAVASTEKYIMPAPIRRAVEDAADNGKLITLNAGRKTRSVIFLESGQIVLNGISSLALRNRAENREE